MNYNTFRSNYIVLVFIALFVIISSCSDNNQDIEPPIDINVRYVNFDNPYAEQKFEIHIGTDEEWDIEYNHNTWFDIEILPSLNQYRIIIRSKINTLGVSRSDDIFIYLVNNKKSSIKITINQQGHQSPNLLDSIPDLRFRRMLFNEHFKTDYVTELDFSQIKYLDCQLKNIRSLKGIEYFKGLISLDCSSNSLSSVDLSKNTELRSLFVSYNSLKSLDLSKNTELQELYCSGNSLTSLDLSENNKLHWLDISDNSIESLDLSSNTELKNLNYSSNSLTSLDISKNNKLRSLYIWHNSLESLDLSNSTELQDVKCSGNSLTSLDLSKNNKLRSLDISDNSLESLDLSSNTELHDIDCSGNSLTSLDLSKNNKLTWLYCNTNNINHLDITRNNQLSLVDCSQNPILKNNVLISKDIYDKAKLTPEKGDEIYRVINN